MSHQEKITRLHEELSRLLDYYCAEYGLTIAEMVGVLEVEKFCRLNLTADAAEGEA